MLNLAVFLGLNSAAVDVNLAAPIAFLVAAAVNYALCVRILFRHKARWNRPTEVFMYLAVVSGVGFVDLQATKVLLGLGAAAWMAKAAATLLGLVLNFIGRRFWVFPEPTTPEWKSQMRRDA